MTAPMFKVFTGAMEPYTKSVDGVERKFIKTTASSTVTDRKGHEIDVKALEKMGATAMGKTIFLNHEYRVPEDLFGKVTDTKTKHMGYDSEKNSIWDLDLDVMVNEANPRAIQAWEAYEQGVTMGVSVGIIVKEWEPKKADKTLPKTKSDGIMVIKDVEFMEASIVGIPANPRTWVQGAVKSINDYKAAEDSGFLATLAAIGNAVPVEDLAEPEIKAVTDDEHEHGETPTEALDPDNDDSLSEQEVAKSDDNEAQVDAAEEVLNSTDPEASSDGATQSASDSDAAAAPEVSVAAGIDVLVNAYRSEIQDLRAQLSAVTRKLDEALEANVTAMKFVERISSLPLGRKATYQHEIKSFRQELSGVYDADFLAFLERDNS